MAEFIWLRCAVYTSLVLPLYSTAQYTHYKDVVDCQFIKEDEGIKDYQLDPAGIKDQT